MNKMLVTGATTMITLAGVTHAQSRPRDTILLERFLHRLRCLPDAQPCGSSSGKGAMVLCTLYATAVRTANFIHRVETASSGGTCGPTAGDVVAGLHTMPVVNHAALGWAGVHNGGTGLG